MNAPLRRGSCPSLSQPMPTGDGLLARITPTGATISCAAFAALCAAAHSCGNGIDRGYIARKHSDPRTDRSLVATIGGGGRQN